MWDSKVKVLCFTVRQQQNNCSLKTHCKVQHNMMSNVQVSQLLPSCHHRGTGWVCMYKNITDTKCLNHLAEALPLTYNKRSQEPRTIIKKTLLLESHKLTSLWNSPKSLTALLQGMKPEALSSCILLPFFFSIKGKLAQLLKLSFVDRLMSHVVFSFLAVVYHHGNVYKAACHNPPLTIPVDTESHYNSR